MQSPGLPAAVGLPSAAQAEPPWLENGPSRLSSVATSWFASGTTAFARFVPAAAVRRSLVLDVPRVSLEQLLADLGPVAAGEGHLEVAERRPHRLGSQAGELDPDRLFGDLADPPRSSRSGRMWPMVAPANAPSPPSPGPG